MSNENERGDPVEVLSRVTGIDLRSEKCKYDRIVVMGMFPDDAIEVSWSGCTPKEVMAMIITVTQALFDHLEPGAVSQYLNVMMNVLTDYADSINTEKGKENVHERKHRRSEGIQPD